MRRLIQLVLAVALVIGFAGAAPAQTVSDELTQTLNAQGFEVVSARYTWLRRIVVTATDGEYSREILVARGAGVILDDKWKRLDMAAPYERKGGARSPARGRPFNGGGGDGPNGAPPSGVRLGLELGLPGLKPGPDPGPGSDPDDNPPPDKR